MQINNMSQTFNSRIIQQNYPRIPSKEVKYSNKKEL